MGSIPIPTTIISCSVVVARNALNVVILVRVQTGEPMKRIIILLNKPAGRKYYACDGSGCCKCPIRFKCFTSATIENVEVDWSKIKTTKSPTRFLESVTGSRIYVRGSKKYRKIWDELKLSEGAIAQLAEVTG